MNRHTDECIPETEFIDYFEGWLPLERQRGIEEHLSTCPTCAGAARAAGAFLYRWQTLSAAAHGEAFRRDRVRAALESLADSYGLPEWAARRLREWARRWRGLAEAALRLEAGASPAVEAVKGLTRSGGMSRFVPVPAGARVRGVPAGSARSVAVGSRTPYARVALTVGGERGEIHVTLGMPPAGSPVPLVALVPEAEDSAPIVGVARAGAEPHRFTVAFGDVLPGSYLLVIEPS